MDKPKQIILLVVGGIIILAILIFTGILPGLRKDLGQGEIELEIWGFEDDEDILKDILTRYSEEIEPRIKVKYLKKDFKTYKQDLINALAAGKSLDIFSLKNTWIEEHKDKLLPLPEGEVDFTTSDFRRTFIDSVQSGLVIDGKIAGLPLFADNLALFYNKDHFNAAGLASPPQNWDDTVAFAKKLTKYSSGGDIERSGLALGSYANVAHSFEIISALFLQSGDKIIDRESGEISLSAKNAGNAIAFFTSFSNPKKNAYFWNGRLPNSLDAFAQNKASMALGLAEDAETIKLKNPRLNFGIAPLPQIVNSDRKSTYSSYVFKAVSKMSENSVEAWKLLLYLSNKENSKQYIELTRRPPARRDLISSVPNSLGAFYAQALYSEDWPVPEETAGLEIFKDVIESIETGKTSTDFAVEQLSLQLNLLLKR